MTHSKHQQPVIKGEGEPPPPPADLSADARRAERRGRFTYAQHTKLNSRLYVREGDGECQTHKLPSLTGDVVLNEAGAIFITDKRQEQVIELVDGAKHVVFSAAKGDRIARVYATGTVVWIWEGPRLSAGTHRAKPERVHRLSKRNDTWETTHSGTLPLKATSFAGNERILAVLDEAGSANVLVASTDDSTLTNLGAHDVNFTKALEWSGDVLLTSHWEPKSVWLVTGAGKSIARKPASELGLKDLPGAISDGIKRQLRDGAIDLIHDARNGLSARWGSSRRERHMRDQGASCWKAVKAHVLKELAEFYDMDMSPVLERDIEGTYLGYFEDAADWHDED